jgi:hypothetical protein
MPAGAAGVPAGAARVPAEPSGCPPQQPGARRAVRGRPHGQGPAERAHDQLGQPVAFLQAAVIFCEAFVS